MKSITSIFLCFSTLSYAQVESSDYLVSVWDEEENYCGYVNQDGDTVLPLVYYMCFTDTLREFAIVIDSSQNGGFPAIDRTGEKLFDVYEYDNGPDYVSEGLFRIVENDLIGFANMQGEIVVEPQYQCAFMFDNGMAQVAFVGTKERQFPESEYWYWVSEEWFFIDKNGNKIEED